MKLVIYFLFFCWLNLLLLLLSSRIFCSLSRSCSIFISNLSVCYSVFVCVCVGVNCAPVCVLCQPGAWGSVNRKNLTLVRHLLVLYLAWVRKTKTGGRKSFQSGLHARWNSPWALKLTVQFHLGKYIKYKSGSSCGRKITADLLV